MISAVILTKNEEKNIKGCIRSVSWCREVIVIDDYSSDSTVRVAQELGAKVYLRHLEGNFAEQRNFGLSKAKGDWVLFVDADERVPADLRDEISILTKNVRSASFCQISLKRADFIWGRKLNYGETGNVKLVRMVRKGTGIWRRRVHEYWEGKGETFIFSNPLLHYPHKTLFEFVKEVDFYSTLHAQQKYEDGERSSLVKILFWPKLKFLNNWILKLGFLDGTAGFVIAVVMSFHSLLAWSKLWLIQKK